MKLKKLYSSREVAQLTGLTARQLQWWEQRKLFIATVPSHKTAAGGFTERRYTPIELLELMVLADLRRKGFTVQRIRKLLQVLKSRFNTRLYEAIEGGGPVTLFIDPSTLRQAQGRPEQSRGTTSSGSPRAKSRGDGASIYARNDAGDLFNLLDDAAQPLLMLGEDIKLRQLIARERPAKKRAKIKPATNRQRPATD